MLQNDHFIVSVSKGVFLTQETGPCHGLRALRGWITKWDKLNYKGENKLSVPGGGGLEMR